MSRPLIGITTAVENARFGGWDRRTALVARYRDDRS